MICREGRFDHDHIPIMSNAMDIPVRLKELNRAFFVMLNVHTQKYEIHSADQQFDTLACTLPFDQLDARAIRYAREYSAARTAEIAKQIDEYNERLACSKEAAVIDKANYKMKETFNYLKNNTHTDTVPREVIDE